jgi:hypothetical protein
MTHPAPKVEPAHLHQHGDLRLGTLFREHTILGETFESAIAQVLGERKRDLTKMLRVQFGTSLDVICDELDKEEQRKALLEQSFSTRHRRPNKKRSKTKYVPVQLTSTIQQLSGLRGTFHFQTQNNTKLSTSMKVTEWKQPICNEEVAALSRGFSLEQTRQMIPLTRKEYDHLSKDEINTLIENEANFPGGGSVNIILGKTKSQALDNLVELRSERISSLREHGHVESIGPVDIWCAKA